MFKETIDCIDAGSEFCPCHLAESGECILVHNYKEVIFVIV